MNNSEDNKYICPECGQSAPKPPWKIAREKGFDASKHCIVMANRFGKITICTHKQTSNICETCVIFRHFTKTVIDEYGREHDIFYDPKKK